MKKLFIIMASFFAVSAHAATGDWMKDLENYRSEVQLYSVGDLFWGQFGNYGKAAIGCAGSARASLTPIPTATS